MVLSGDLGCIVQRSAFLTRRVYIHICSCTQVQDLFGTKHVVSVSSNATIGDLKQARLETLPPFI